MPLSDIRKEAVPDHIGIIMDGNGRWAQQKNLPRSAGHNAGMNTAREIIKAAVKADIKYLTLYTFSTENWKRTKQEVGFLMNLLKNNLRKEFEHYKKEKIRVCVAGDKTGLPKDVQKEIADVEKASENFDGLCLVFAINYGGRDEIIRATKKILADKAVNPTLLTEDSFAKYLDVPTMPPLDLLIRTGGEKRISNFLLWHAAYCEFDFLDILWPDFTEKEFYKAISTFQKRTRRFGGYSTGNIHEQTS
ncbi:MAG TPA: polyprenyl diphosphate synthase [Treponemataceae bacterium]|nr:polyprenyl diphosphate synthase [Treponemataceae bacterium]